MKKEEMTTVDFLLEAVGIVAAMIYLGLQIYYGIVYGVAFNPDPCICWTDAACTLSGESK